VSIIFTPLSEKFGSILGWGLFLDADWNPIYPTFGNTQLLLLYEKAMPVV